LNVWADAAIKKDVHTFPNAIRIAQEIVIVQIHRNAVAKDSALMK